MRRGSRLGRVWNALYAGFKVVLLFFKGGEMAKGQSGEVLEW